MRLEVWLKIKKIRVSKFAKAIQVERSTVRSYIHNGVKPREEVMKKIYIKTLGAVTANDFYKLSDRLFNESIKPKPDKEILHGNSFRY